MTESIEKYLTAEQEAALAKLTPKRRSFVLEYVGEAQGVATEAARRAGYAHPDPEGARLLGDARIRAGIKALRAPAEEQTIASIEELRRLWTAVARGEELDVAVSRDGEPSEVPASLTTRMRASELLGRSQGAFLDRHEVTAQTAWTPPVSREDALLRLEAVLARARAGDRE